jgi:hypothetical protein
MPRADNGHVRVEVRTQYAWSVEYDRDNARDEFISGLMVNQYCV